MSLSSCKPPRGALLDLDPVFFPDGGNLRIRDIVTVTPGRIDHDPIEAIIPFRDFFEINDFSSAITA